MALTVDRSKEVITGSHMMRDGALEYLEDDDLSYSPGGFNLTLGELFKQFGELQYGYTQSLKTYQHDWAYHDNTVGLTTDISNLKSWFAGLDSEMMQELESLDEDDLSKEIDRTNGVIRTVEQQLEIYSQATLIFLAKVVVYFRAMEKTLPPSIDHYIG